MTEQDQIEHLRQQLKEAQWESDRWESAYNGVRIELQNARDRLERQDADFALIEAHRNQDQAADLAAVTARAERAEAQRDRFVSVLQRAADPAPVVCYARAMAISLKAHGWGGLAQVMLDLADALDAIAEEETNGPQTIAR